MALHELRSRRGAIAESPLERVERLEARLDEARSILSRLLESEDRIGRVYPVIDGARRWLARGNRA